MTGCLTTNGTGSGNIVNVAMGTSPAKACGSNQKLIHLSGGTITKITAGTGLTTAGSGGTGPDTSSINNGFATLGLQSSYALPQACSGGQVAKWDATNSDWTCANFATSGQNCRAGQFATGIAADGSLNCAQPTVAQLQGSPCTVNGRPSTLQVSTDSTTGAVSLTCTPVYEVSVTSSPGTMDAISILDDTNRSFDHTCNPPADFPTCTTTWSTLIPKGDLVRVFFESGDSLTGGGASFQYTCPSEATQTASNPNPGDYRGNCPVVGNATHDATINADYAITATFGP